MLEFLYVIKCVMCAVYVYYVTEMNK